MLAGIACSSGASDGVRTSAGSRPTTSSAELPLCDRTLKLCYNTPRYLPQTSVCILLLCKQFSAVMVDRCS